MQSDKPASNTISKHPRSSMATFPNSAAWVWPPWLEGRCQDSFAVLSATNRRDTEDFVVAHIAWPARSPSGNRIERAYLRVATPISIWLNAQRDSKSAFWIALQLGSSTSAPPRSRTRGRRIAAWPPCQPTSLPIMPHR